MDAALAANSGRRLLISFEYNMRARSDIGWGHALPSAFGMHCEPPRAAWPHQVLCSHTPGFSPHLRSPHAGLCWKARRRCHVRLFDYHLGDYWGFANGESWGAPWRRSAFGPFANGTRIAIYHVGLWYNTSEVSAE
eukprot:1283508-Prymnesium_polylepis.2